MTTITELGLINPKDSWFSFRLDVELMQQLTELSQDSGVPKAELIRRGIQRIMSEYNLR